jgi:putative hydrolase of the HAD superfamily
MEWEKGHIKAVCFDLDNTLLDRKKTFQSFAEKLIQTYFFEASQQEQQEMMETMIEKDKDGYKEKTELFAELLEEWTWEHKPGLQELMDFYTLEYVHGAVMMEDALSILAYCRSKYKLALITNGRTSIQYGKIDKLDIRKSFDAILVSEEVKVKKPDPHIFRLAMERLNMKPEQCVFIGDHPKNDMEGAMQAGMYAIWLRVNQPWPDSVEVQPVAAVTGLKSLLNWI